MKKSFVIWATVIILAIIIGLLIAGNAPSSQTQQEGQANVDSPGGASTGSESEDTPRIITIDAARFEYAPNTITVKKGERVKFMINNTDTLHGIAIPALGVSGIESLEFVANESGTYQFRCPTMCGQGHRNMTGTLIVEE